MVTLNDVKDLVPETARALADYVASGRTLVVFCGPEVVPADYNRLLVDEVPRHGGLLPARLTGRVGNAVLKTTAEKITQVENRSPYLEGLVEAPDIYEGVLVYEYFRTDASGIPDSSVLARLSSGDPLLLYKPFGQGHVLLFTTTATTQWTNLPVRNLFVPLLMRIAHLSVRGQTERRNLVAGQPFEADLAPDLKGTATVQITGPLGPAGETATEERETTPDEEKNLLRFAKTWHLGYYTFDVPEREDLRGLFATNPDGTESDLAPMADDKLRAALGAGEVHVAESFEQLIQQFEQTARTELWQPLLALCLALTVLEPMLANRVRPGEGRDAPRAAASLPRPPEQRPSTPPP